MQSSMDLSTSAYSNASAPSMPMHPNEHSGVPPPAPAHQLPAYHHDPVGHAAPAPPQPHHHQSQGSSKMDLQEIINRFDISIARGDELAMLYNYRIVFIADDSGSMQLPACPGYTRWTELGTTISMLVDMAACFSPDGIDIHFLNRPAVLGVKSNHDPALQQSLAQGPSGGTPLSQCTQAIINKYQGGKDVLLMIATDGEPNEGPEAFKRVVRSAIQRRFRFQILACTNDEAEIGWLNKFDREFQEVDVMDDFDSERKEVLQAGRCQRFTRGDYLIKALLGAICAKFDGWDESPTMMKKMKKKKCIVM